MKRIGNIFDQFCSFPNLLAAAKRARQGTRLNGEAALFMYRLEYELLCLQEELVTLSYYPRPYRFFEIFDPKHRTISVAAFRDRVVHHALVAILEPIYERRFISDSYATRKGKGARRAVLQAQYFLRSNRWFLKCDVEKFFDSIDHDILINLLQKKIKDRNLIEIAVRIIQNSRLEGKGLPIGNLTSQFLANVYLHPFDCFVKQTLNCPAYVRYMDDFVLLHPDKAGLKAVQPAIEGFLQNHLSLDLKATATCLNTSANGLSFLGLRIFPGLIRMHPVNLRRLVGRWQKRESEWLAGRLKEDALMAIASSYIAWLNQFPAQRVFVALEQRY